MQPSDATPPEKPESDASGDTAAEDAGTQPSDATPPEKSEGDATGETTEQTTGAQPSDMTLPDKPEGDDSAAMDGSALPDGQTPPDALPGGQTFTAGTQTLTGDISVDAISSLQMRLCSGSTYTGAIQMVENAQRGTSADAQVNVTIGSGNLTLTATDDALHSDGALTIAGGTVLAAGGSGSMGMQLTTEQPYLLQQSGAAIVAGETLSIADADGMNILDACQAPCTVSFLFYTSPDLTDGQSYTLQGSGSASAQLEAQIGALQGGMMPGGPAGGPGADGERLDTQPPRRARRRACRTCGWCTGRHKYLNFPAKALRFAGLGRRRSAFFAFLPWTVAFARWICYTVSCTTLGERKNGRTTEKEKYIFRQARFCIGGSGRIGRAGQYMAIPVSRGKVWRRDLFARLYYPGADLWLFHDRR